MAKLKSNHRYLQLVEAFPLRPIRSERELTRAIAVIDALLDRGELSSEEADYLDVLADLVERFDCQCHPSEPLCDSAMLSHLIEAKDVDQSTVAKATGIAHSTISEILSGKRQLNRQQIGKLASYFHVSPGAFT
jgi:HTH-type transcriptional regulator/antitoxin HigA